MSQEIKLNIYSIKDSVTGEFGALTFSPTDAVVLRDLSIELQYSPEKSKIKARPGDFALYKLGTFGINTGTIEPCNPDFVASLQDLIEVKV